MAVSSTTASSSGGVNVESIVSGLMSIERRPLDKLTSKESSYQAKLTALGLLKSKMATLQSAAKALGSGSTSSLTASKATPSDSSILSATAGSTAVAGTYSLAVTSLAQSQKLVAAGQASSTAAIGSGTPTVVTFQFGTISGGTLTNGVYSGATFTPGASSATLTIDSSNNTLEGIRNAINAANLGVSATLVNDGSGTPYRLALSVTASGAANSLRISTDGADAAITNLLAHDPSGTQNLAETVTAQNASFSVNGIAVSKASNTVNDVIDGVSLTLTKTGNATLTVERDTAAASKAVGDFVTAYNELYTAMKNSFAYKSGSALAGDPTLRGLQQQMREIVATAATGGTYANLFEVGVSGKSDGTLQLDSSKLASVMSSNFADVAALFSSASGFGTRFDNWSTTALGTGGAFDSRTTTLNDALRKIGDDKAALEVRLSALEKRYRAQYSSLNVALANMSQTSTYLSQQLSRL